MTQDSAIEELSSMFDAYARNLPARVDTMEMLGHKLENEWDANAFAELHRSVHSINGSSSIYCFHDLHKAAKELEEFLATIQDAVHFNAAKTQVAEHIKKIKKILQDTSVEETLKAFIQQNTQA